MGKADFEIRSAGDALVCEAGGIVGLDEAREGRLLVRAELLRRPARKVLVDLRRAVILLSAAGWDALISEAQAGAGALSCRIGVLTDESAMELLYKYCFGMIAKGHTRLPFIREEDATSWLGEAAPQLRQISLFLPLQPVPQTPPARRA
jgi:hypothetical protein